jgi:uncharacterized protein YbjT (DUF2867 family)
MDGVDKVFLLWPGPSPTGIEAAVEALAARAKHIVFLSAISAEQGFWGDVEKAIVARGVDWTFLRAGGFATNTLGWAEMVWRDGVVRWPYGAAARSLIHERDLADVAVRALTEPGHVGQTYDLTGPEGSPRPSRFGSSARRSAATCAGWNCRPAWPGNSCSRPGVTKASWTRR